MKQGGEDGCACFGMDVEPEHVPLDVRAVSTPSFPVVINTRQFIETLNSLEA